MVKRHSNSSSILIGSVFTFCYVESEQTLRRQNMCEFNLIFVLCKRLVVYLIVTFLYPVGEKYPSTPRCI